MVSKQQIGMKYKVVVGFALLLLSSSICYSQVPICDGSHRYNEFIEFLEQQGIKSGNNNKWRACLSYFPIADTNIDSSGFYSLRMSCIHCPHFLYVQYKDGKRYYLKKYRLEDFLTFVRKHYPKVYPNQSECESLDRLMDFWCKHLIIRE